VSPEPVEGGAAPSSRAVIVAAHDEADRIEATLEVLTRALPDASIWVADDASTDATAALARARGARVVTRTHPLGKGANVTAAAEVALREGTGDELFLLCDADLGASAGELSKLLDAVSGGECDLAVAAFLVRVGGGVGGVVGFARWAIERRCGYRAAAPISGQRAMRADVLAALLPFAAGYGMETAMTIDAVRSGYRVSEIELELEHRATGRSLRGFVHRGRQLRDIVGAYLSRRNRQG
jgi:glycosyltransferase involved in cell wall biosynthesis